MDLNGWMLAPNLNCQRDEYSPAGIWKQNRGAGQLLKDVCSTAQHKMSPEQGKHLFKAVRNCKRVDSKYIVTRTATTRVMRMRFVNMPNLADDGIPDNPCFPKTLLDDPGFALMTNDPCYNTQPASKRNTRLYRNASAANILLLR
ncbi:uncharacterized protein ColSpa_06810 [Colletotrichum spaethianum]|uniref:Uncharacterized protein n=1 Tax=Colletotrichum spaethianum TaxID=700344 RepID=A0AA37LFS7_9PEZI|nr:uncharacterized protein ColSpa_06810 [Colletotrichum spaethianum]GKT46629.1 hypothetical protein ColSpa_06810 [Colletotrichum spaethianum]